MTTTTLWSPGHSSVLPGEMPLAPHEAQCVARAKERAKDVVLMDHKHMAERFVPVEEGLPAVSHWLFELPDFTRLFKDWYRRYVTQIFACYQPNAYAMCSDDGTWLLLRYEGERPRDIIARAFERGEYGVVRSLMHRVDQVEQDAEAALQTHAARTNGSVGAGLEPLVSAVTRFAAFGLENLFPETFATARFPQVALHQLYWTPVSAWQRLLDEAVVMLDRVYAGEEREREAMERYARESSFLRWGDIASADDDRAFTERFFAGLRREYPHVVAIWEAEQERRHRARVYGSPLAQHEHELDELRRRIAPADLECFNVLAKFAGAAQRYNEMRRIIFTRTLRALREHCEQREINWRSVALSDLLSTTTSERRSTHGTALHLQGSVT